jgi:protein ImuB
MFACLYRPPHSDRAAGEPDQDHLALHTLAHDFSPRYEIHADDLVVVDVSGLERLLGPPHVIAEELRRSAAVRGVRLHIAIAGTVTAAIVLAQAQPGVTIVAPGTEAVMLARVAIDILPKVAVQTSDFRLPTSDFRLQTSDFLIQTSKRWGLKTLGDLAALPPPETVARFGRQALVWQAIARGEEVRPMVPTLPEERFEATLDLEWPIEELEPLSFVLTRLLEPLSTRLERRDRGAAVLHVLLRLVTRETCMRRLELPAPIRDVRTLRTLALLDLESHPPGAAVDRVTIVIDPTPGRVLQHTLFTRAHPTPEQISTLLARLGAVMGQDRIGAPAIVDTYRPGAFAVTPFATLREPQGHKSDAIATGGIPRTQSSFVSALRRCREPVPARVAVCDGRPVRVTTDRRGFVGGAVVQCAGPWRSSGNWWLASRTTLDPAAIHPTSPAGIATNGMCR